MPCQNRIFVRSYQKYNACKGRYVTVNVYRTKTKVPAQPMYGYNPGQLHPTTGKRIPQPYDRNAAYPGSGFCRTVKTKKVKVYKTVKVKKLVGERVVSKTPVSGWHRCGSKSKSGGCR